MQTLSCLFRRYNSSRRTYQHRLNCWLRFCGDAVPTTEDFARFRNAATKAGLSPTTIETTINDICCVLRAVGEAVPTRGRPLRRPAPATTQPTLADIERVYLVADQAKEPTTIPHEVRPGWWRGLLCLSLWTGFRINDLRELRWSDVFSDRIERVANKTGKRHVIPVTHDIRRNLDTIPKRGETVFQLPRGSVRFARRELKRLCELAGVANFGFQQIRRASITEWSSVNSDAGSTIHGTGLGVRRYYVEPYKVLCRAAEGFSLPNAMRDPDQQQHRRAIVCRLVEAAGRLSEPDISRLIRTAESW